MMKRSLLFVLLLSPMLCISTETKKINLRDGAIWQEKPVERVNEPEPCEVFNSSVCPGYDNNKTDIQRERDRREKNRHYKDAEKGKWRD